MAGFSFFKYRWCPPPPCFRSRVPSAGQKKKKQEQPIDVGDGAVVVTGRAGNPTSCETCTRNESGSVPQSAMQSHYCKLHPLLLLQAVLLSTGPKKKKKNLFNHSDPTYPDTTRRGDQTAVGPGFLSCGRQFSGIITTLSCCLRRVYFEFTRG